MHMCVYCTRSSPSRRHRCWLLEEEKRTREEYQRLQDALVPRIAVVGQDKDWCRGTEGAAAWEHRLVEREHWGERHPYALHM